MSETPAEDDLATDALDHVRATPAAVELIRALRDTHGPLLFHQSGGCCDGSAPMCYPRDEFKIGRYDVKLGEVEDTPVYIGGQQYERWKHTRLIIDAVPGRGAGFSLEAPTGKRFLTRSELIDEAGEAIGDVCT